MTTSRAKKQHLTIVLTVLNSSLVLFTAESAAKEIKKLEQGVSFISCLKPGEEFRLETFMGYASKLILLKGDLLKLKGQDTHFVIEKTARLSKFVEFSSNLYIAKLRRGKELTDKSIFAFGHFLNSENKLDKKHNYLSALSFDNIENNWQLVESSFDASQKTTLEHRLSQDSCRSLNGEEGLLDSFSGYRTQLIWVKGVTFKLRGQNVHFLIEDLTRLSELKVLNSSGYLTQGASLRPNGNRFMHVSGYLLNSADELDRVYNYPVFIPVEELKKNWVRKDL